MLYPFLTLEDGTDVVYSNTYEHNGKICVLIKFERWNDERDDFDSMECELPNGKMDKIIGFTGEEANYYNKKMIKLQDSILEWSKEDSIRVQSDPGCRC